MFVFAFTALMKNQRSVKMEILALLLKYVYVATVYRTYMYIALKLTL